jgi:hypothetical protein
MEEVLIEKKGRTAKYCKWCKAVNGSFTTHDTTECRRFEKDGSSKDRLVKPFDSIKKPWKKTGGGESSQMAFLTGRLIKLKKKHTKSKKHGKKRSTCRIVIPTVTRIVGPVAQEV